MAERPIPGVQAFQGSSEEHIQSQAAILLAVGAHLRGEAAPTRFVERVKEFFEGPDPEATEVIPPEQKEELQLPDVPRAHTRLLSEHTRKQVKERFGLLLSAERHHQDEPFAVLGRLPEIAEECWRNPSLETTANLLATSLRHEYPLVRVAAASSYFHLTSEPAQCIEALVEGTKEKDPLTQRVAATALARVSPDHSRLGELNAGSSAAQGAGAGHTTLIVHGTWAKNGDWFIPNKPGNFFDYLKADIAQDMWTGNPFLWSGSWSDAARAIAAQELADWVKKNAGPKLNLFGHSHGANVAMLANHLGVSYGQLALLSCPVHWNKYSPVLDPAPTSRRRISIRVKMDLVILADGGGQRFKDKRIEENILDIWFDHFATHDPQRWKDPKYKLPGMVDHVHAMSAP